ncbi:MAG: GGDEF domain-containing protein [Christensenellales bacterium]
MEQRGLAYDRRSISNGAFRPGRANGAVRPRRHGYFGGNALAISALDLGYRELRLIKRGIELPQIEADKPMLFSTFNNLLIAQKLIHPEDGDGYLRGTALSALRTVFFGGEKQVYLRYRQKVDGEYRWVALAIVAGKRCESGCAQVAMVLSGANGSGHANRPSEPRGVDYDCDPLTGLLNRRRFERDLEWWGRNRPETLTCVYIDVVGLHEINNHLGHKAGDGMLCAVAGAMQRMFPLADTYRIGGDEFVVLWADHTGEQGAEAAARIKALLRESNYELSVGVHQIEPDENLEDGVDRGNAMRRDKEAYYRETGNLDQMRVLNEKLERILVEKRDMDMFLRAIARYIGVYAVDNDTGGCGASSSRPLPADREGSEGAVQPGAGAICRGGCGGCMARELRPVTRSARRHPPRRAEGMVCATFRRRTARGFACR